MYYPNFIGSCMSKLIGNISNIVDMNYLISHLEDTVPGIIVRADMINNKINDPEYPTYPGEIEHDNAVLKMWNDANYDFKSAWWYLYRAGDHYSTEVEQQFCDFLNIDLMWSSIFKVPPGCTAPLHREAGPNIDIDKEIRYFCQLNPATPGHMLVIENETFGNLNPGDIYKWDHVKQYHAAANCGLTPVYYIFIQGVARD